VVTLSHSGAHGGENRDMRTLSRKAWPPFAAVAVLALLGLFVLNGVAAGVVLFVALIGTILAAINALRDEQPNDGVGGIGGPMGHM
jgi:hypothetical protein